MPVQTWPLAYWPDGSLKWIGVATVVGPSSGTQFKLATDARAPEKKPGGFQLKEDEKSIEIDTGKMRFASGNRARA